MRDHHEFPPGAEPSRVSRRAVVQGAAWSVPVIIVAASAPALAASSGVVTVSSSVSGCTFATQPAKNRRAILTFVSSGAPTAVVITSVTEDGNAVTSVTPSTFTPTSAGVKVTVLFTTGDANTHNRTLVVTYAVGGGAPVTSSVTVTGLTTTCA